MDNLHYEEYNPQEHSWDNWHEEEEEQVQCLYCKDVLPSTKAAFEHMKSVHGFDFQETRKRLGLDFYQCIRLINYIRQQVKENDDYTNTSFDKKESFLSDDQYLQPVLQDDPLLFAFDDDEDFEEDEEKKEEKDVLDLEKVQPTTELEKKLLQMLIESQEELKNLKGQFEEYKSTVKRTFYDTLTEDH
ncbi:unnamed protein product [Rhizopus microsporus]